MEAGMIHLYCLYSLGSGAIGVCNSSFTSCFED